jgi:hypothetical protein
MVRYLNYSDSRRIRGLLVPDSASPGYRRNFCIDSYITGSIWGVNSDLNHASIVEASAGSEISFGLVKDWPSECQKPTKSAQRTMDSHRQDLYM